MKLVQPIKRWIEIGREHECQKDVKEGGRVSTELGMAGKPEQHSFMADCTHIRRFYSKASHSSFINARIYDTNSIRDFRNNTTLFLSLTVTLAQVIVDVEQEIQININQCISMLTILQQHYVQKQYRHSINNNSRPLTT